MDASPAMERCRTIPSRRHFGAEVVGLHRLHAVKDVERARA